MKPAQSASGSVTAITSTKFYIMYFVYTVGRAEIDHALGVSKNFGRAIVCRFSRENARAAKDLQLRMTVNCAQKGDLDDEFSSLRRSKALSFAHWQAMDACWLPFPAHRVTENTLTP